MSYLIWKQWTTGQNIGNATTPMASKEDAMAYAKKVVTERPSIKCTVFQEICSVQVKGNPVVEVSHE